MSGIYRVLPGLFCVLNVLAAAGVQAGPATAGRNPETLREMSEAFQALVTRVSPAVVKILVTAYGPVDRSGPEGVAVVGRQHAIGSGVIVDPDGYIITNAHVVESAQRVRVVLSAARTGDPGKAGAPRILSAKTVGVEKDADLAVLKVDASGLPTLPIGSYGRVHQGQLVLAFGSPEGLENSVTMGLVSSVMRQPDPDRPFVFIQTDAAINPGNSGGPLVDTEGKLVGINSFILSESGGSEGIGFAIPSGIVRFVYNQIRRYGHVHRRAIGANFQTITPEMAAGLGLPREWGIIVSDVMPGGPADTAGLKVQDVIAAMDGTPIDSLPTYQAALYQRPNDKPAQIEVLRAGRKLTLEVPIVERQHEFDDLQSLATPEKSLIPALGILGVEITGKIAEIIPDLRVHSGVVVLARSAEAPVDSGLVSGDIIHSLNGTAITTLDGLREALSRFKPGAAMAMQIEREGRLMYVAFESE